MRRIKSPKLVFAAIAVVGLSACAQNQPTGGQPLIGAISRLQCSAADWFQVGLYDGLNGREQPERYNFVRTSCDGHGQRVDADEYFEGYEEGLRRAGA